MENDLMVKRVEVVGYYPGSEFDTGQILTWTDGFVRLGPVYSDMKPGDSTCVSESEVNKSPLIFRPIPWYKHREDEEMPKYLKDIEVQGLAYEVAGYFQGNGMFENTEGVECHTEHFEPMTQQDYEAYLKTK